MDIDLKWVYSLKRQYYVREYEASGKNHNYYKLFLFK